MRQHFSNWQPFEKWSEVNPHRFTLRALKRPGGIYPETVTIKIADFGIARITDSRKTKTGTDRYLNLDGRTILISPRVTFSQ